jgi:hypothetical protein
MYVKIKSNKEPQIKYATIILLLIIKMDNNKVIVRAKKYVLSN